MKFQTSLWSNVLLSTLGGHEGVTKRFAAFCLNAVTGYTLLMVKARTVAQTFASVHRFTGSLAPGAFVAGVTVPISAQPNLHFGCLIDVKQVPFRSGYGFYDFSDAVSGCRQCRVTRLGPHNLADGEWHAWPLTVENRIQGTTQQEVLQGSSAEQQFGQNDCRLMSTHCEPCGGAQISKSPSLAISPEMD